MFNLLINENYSIGVDTELHQSVLEHAMSKKLYSVGTSMCMVPSNLNLRVGKTSGYQNKI